MLWVLFGYSLAFGDAGNGGFIGNFDFIGLKDMTGQVSGTIPSMVFSAFQLTFAVITPALITGAIADRMRWAAWVGFIALWSVLVYLPVAHWVFAGGWLAARGALDFAGGTVVHVNAGAGALALVLLLGQAEGLAGLGDAAALPSAHPAGNGHPLVRVVRLQRRLGAGGQPGRRRRPS